MPLIDRHVCQPSPVKPGGLSWQDLPTHSREARMISKQGMRSVSALLLVLAGCASDQQMLGNDQDNALQVAVRRGQFEMSCPNATGTVLSSNILQPVLWNGLERAEYTVGVAGCGQKATYIAVCQIGSSSCLAVSARNAVDWQ